MPPFLFWPWWDLPPGNFVVMRKQAAPAPDVRKASADPAAAGRPNPKPNTVTKRAAAAAVAASHRNEL